MKRTKLNHDLKTNWSNIYTECNHHKYSKIINILYQAKIKSNFKNFIKSNKVILLFSTIIVLMLLFYTFRTDLLLVLYSVLFFFAMFLIILYYSTYTLTLAKTKLELNINFKKYNILLEDLVNVYLSKSKTSFFGFPIYAYSLNIIYIENDKPMIITLPTIMLDKKKTISFFKCFEIEIIKDEEAENEKIERNTKKMILQLIKILLIVIVVAIFIGFAVYYNNN